MNVNDESLSKEELEYIIERLRETNDGLADDDDTVELSSVEQAALQADLKMRLQRRAEEMRARNEEVPEHLLDLIDRL